MLPQIYPSGFQAYRRIKERDDGWKDAEAAVAWNRHVMHRACVGHERKIDVTGKSPAAVLAEAIDVLGVSADGCA